MRKKIAIECCCREINVDKQCLDSGFTEDFTGGTYDDRILPDLTSWRNLDGDKINAWLQIAPGNIQGTYSHCIYLPDNGGTYTYTVDVTVATFAGAFMAPGQFWLGVYRRVDDEVAVWVYSISLLRLIYEQIITDTTTFELQLVMSNVQRTLAGDGYTANVAFKVNGTTYWTILNHKFLYRARGNQLEAYLGGAVIGTATSTFDDIEYTLS